MPAAARALGRELDVAVLKGRQNYLCVKQHRSFGRGTLRFLSPENSRVLAFVRQWEDERILVVANLSRFTQAAEVDLSEFKGMAPVETFGKGQLWSN